MMSKAIFLTLQLRCLVALIAGAFLGQSSAYAADAIARNTAKPASIQVMILGSYHMGNPGLDQVKWRSMT